MRAKLTTCLLAVAFLAGCGGIGKYTTVARLKETPYEPTQEVEIFPADKKPPRVYEVIAKLETRIGAGAELGQLYESMREKAKEIGADAVINVVEEAEQVANTSTSYNFMFGSSYSNEMQTLKSLRGEAVKYQ